MGDETMLPCSLAVKSADSRKGVGRQFAAGSVLLPRNTGQLQHVETDLGKITLQACHPHPP